MIDLHRIPLPTLAALFVACASTRAEAPQPAPVEDPSGGAQSAPAPAAAPLELAFVTHLQAHMPEQDVFIERVPGSGEVYRVTEGDHDLNAPLYRSAQALPHDPFDRSALGPYPRGAPLGLTLGQWLAHDGAGTYQCRDGVAKLDLRFEGLVPDGMYTMWHAFIALPPTEPFSGTLDLPLGARDGSESVFVAHPDGTARFVRSFSPCLQLSHAWTSSMLALNYHSDGETHRALPGGFGKQAHVPLFAMLPRAKETDDVVAGTPR